MAEKQVEKYLNEKVQDCGGISRKWSSPNHAGVLDRILVFLGGEVWFIEVKDNGKKPTPTQKREILRLREVGANAGYLAGQGQVAEFVLSGQYREQWMNGHLERNL